MFKRIFTSIFILIFIIAIAIVTINIYKNNPQRILKSLGKEIYTISNDKLKTHSDWLWQADRRFTFDIIYMNIFSPGTASIVIKEEGQIPAFIIEAEVSLNDYFKKLYDAGMAIKSTVDKDNKLSLRYQELSYTPEKTRSKEIVFDPVANIAQRAGIKFKIPDSAYDPLAAFFNLLNSEFNIGEPIVLNLLSKEEIYEFKATPIEFKNNIYKLQGEVHRQDRSSTHGATFTIWIKNGGVRIPLLIKVVSAAGPVYLRLKEVE